MQFSVLSGFRVGFSKLDEVERVEGSAIEDRSVEKLKLHGGEAIEIFWVAIEELSLSYHNGFV